MVLPTPLQAFSGMPKASATTEKQTIVDGEKMTGAEALVRSLEDLDVKDVFGVPGGAILPVYDSIKDDTKFRFVLMRHEQAAGHAAEGYALTTGQVGVCIVTSGPVSYTHLSEDKLAAYQPEDGWKDLLVDYVTNGENHSEYQGHDAIVNAHNYRAQALAELPIGAQSLMKGDPVIPTEVTVL